MAWDDEARLSEVARELHELRDRLDDVREQLHEARYVGRSDDERVVATVTSSGELVDLEIDPRAFRRPDSTALAGAILAAIRCARADAAAHSTGLLRDVLGDSVDMERLADGEDAAEMLGEVGRHLWLLPGGAASTGMERPGPGDWAA